ncbi:magnesium-transporting ATPase, P-type 1-like isoform X2 [Phoenix dactylifera]|uniref:Magnesium-transporting ATPase, P-type 1 n=1 Tax=Phoenix dactylifera TaxID=42345 RepID=A0A8B7BF42_PHODC|nr:magnesium-transporting ATPase, P-type 1-like isoform X2 [Phoenix dactylifera]
MDTRNSINESLVNKGHHAFRISEKRSHLRAFIAGCLRKFIPARSREGGTRSEAEEKVYSWIYTLAQADKDMVFEYVKSTERGLSFKEAERRLKEGGRNIPLDHTFPSWWQLWWNAFLHPFNIILVVMAVLSYLAADNANGSIMLILVLISVGLRFHQEYNSSRAAMQLSELLKSPVRVQRCAGRVIQTELVVQIDQRDIVPGDIVYFSPGDLFPGDVRLLTAKELVVSQSSLTGESGTMEKIANIREDRRTPLLELKNICFMGTSVVSGSGTGLVISTGSNTYMSTIFATLGKEKPPDAFEKGVLCASYALICIMMLPLIVNTNLAKGAIAMARGRCIVKSLSSIQNMGAMDILCIDKTGTLTMDRVIVIHHLDSWGFPSERVLKFAFLNSYFKTELKGPIDDAILAYVYTNGYRFQSSKWRKIDEVPFDFIRRRMSVIVETDLNTILDDTCPGIETASCVITKGALEEVLNICTSIEQIDSGVTAALTPEDRSRVLQKSEELSNDGLRVLGVAIRKMKTKNISMSNYTAIESNMVFLGLISFFDPPKDSAKQALWQLAERGVKAKVLTGDSLSLAIKVCKEVGIRTTHVITGPDLEVLDHDEFHETIKRVTVLARLTPIQKLRVVQSLQKVGNHVVGFLGDGINDSLALDAADVGISVDSAASVAKNLADIILLEKDLNVLVSGVERGRLTYGNTMKYIKMSLVANISSVISLLIATLFLRFEPLTPRQLLTQNFLYNIGQIAIPWDKMEEGYAKSPQRWSSKELPIFMLWNGPVCSIFDVATFLFLWFYYGAYRVSASEFFHTAWFVEGLLMQALIIHMVRTEKIPFIQDMASWPVIFSTITVTAVGIIIPFTPVGKVMGLTYLPLSYYGFLVILFLGYFTLGQVVKRAYILTNRQWL